MRVPRVVFRVDSNYKIGTGHLQECLCLANHTNIKSFFCIKKNRKSVDLINYSGFPVKVLNPDGRASIVSEINSLNDFIKEVVPDVIIVDLPFINSRYCDKINLYGAKLLVLNALFYPIKADAQVTTVFKPLVVNKNYYGVNFILMRPGIAAQEPIVVFPKVKNILVMFGGSDPENYTLKSLQSLKMVDRNFQTTIVMGSLNKNEKIIKSFLKLYHKPHRLYVGVKSEKQLIKIMKESDMAIVSGGYTLSELLHLGIPCVALAQNLIEKNRIYKLFPGSIFKNLGSGKEISIIKLKFEILKIIDNYKWRKKTNNFSPKLIDGKGVVRVCSIIKDLTNKL